MVEPDLCGDEGVEKSIMRALIGKPFSAMKQNELIKDLLDVESEIVFDSHKILEDIKFLSKTDHAQEAADIISGDRFFIRCGNYMWDILILNLTKLFHKEESYSLIKLLNVATNSRKEITWHNQGGFENLQQFRSEILSEKTQGQISKCSHIRHKRVAHLDRNRLNEDVRIHLIEATELLDLAKRSVSEVSRLLTGSTLSWEFDPLGRAQDTVTKLVRLRALIN